LSAYWRLIGTDAPETFASGVECGAERALRGLKRLASGRRVTLTTDPTQDRFDHFGRLLAYVRTSTRQLNVAQIGRGWAKAYVFETPVRQYDRFRRAQRRARRHDRGVWALCDGEFHAG
jgi:micrococcal nuclease